MLKRTQLQVGDSIRILKVPKADLDQREREKKTLQADDMLPTATVLETIIQQCPVVIIDHIDEYNKPWFWVRLEVDNEFQQHSLAVMDDDSWELIYQKRSGGHIPVAHQLAEVKKQIDDILDEYEEEYQILADESEKQYSRNETLRKKYEALDKKTGLHALFEKGALLKKKAE
ncbi:hypothetical protein [Candidatus Albibeggiatoa sp. nov. NOAA]|uniref:hypothetical protein n=1 Tax=Candidatus Albibeggiatoa sp. nov. NOAA TaxID=3162724 RepID=UPI0032F43E2F|nr:hypothetical protein [Thiotrichaceae bacterium]